MEEEPLSELTTFPHCVRTRLKTNKVEMPTKYFKKEFTHTVEDFMAY